MNGRVAPISAPLARSGTPTAVGTRLDLKESLEFRSRRQSEGDRESRAARKHQRYLSADARRQDRRQNRDRLSHERSAVLANSRRRSGGPRSWSAETGELSATLDVDGNLYIADTINHRMAS
jgi:hypothetical protein